MNYSLPRMLRPTAIAVLTLSVLAFAQARATTIFGTYPSWAGTYAVEPFGSPIGGPGGQAGAATYGETFIDPTGISLIKDFTFFIESVNGATLNMQGILLGWTGSLYGGAGDGHGTGTPSTPAPLPGSVHLHLHPVTINIPGGATVVPGQKYFIGLTTSAAPAASATTTAPSASPNGRHQDTHVANDGSAASSSSTTPPALPPSPTHHLG